MATVHNNSTDLKTLLSDIKLARLAANDHTRRQSNDEAKAWLKLLAEKLQANKCEQALSLL